MFGGHHLVVEHPNPSSYRMEVALKSPHPFTTKAMVAPCRAACILADLWLTCGHDSRSLKKALVMKKRPSSRYSIQTMWGVYGDIIFFAFINDQLQLDMEFGLIMVNPRMGAPKWLCELGRRCSELLAVDICGNGE